MTFLNTSLIRKLTLFLAAAMLSVSAIALDFNQTQRLADQGSASAQYNLGVMHYKGDGIPQDHSKAIEWFQKAANQGHTKAKSNLKVMNINGKGGVSATAAKLSFEEVKSRAEQGHSNWQLIIAYQYENGMDVRQDYSKAFYWYKKSADQNDKFGQAMLGRMYESGRGVRQNKTIAKEWYGKSCDNGYQGGCDEYKRLNE